MRRRPAERRLHPSITSKLPASTSRAVVEELQRPIEHWAFTSRADYRGDSWQQQIARDKAEQLKHLNALRDSVKQGLKDGLSEQWLVDLDRLEEELSIVRRWSLLHKRIPNHRPSYARFRAECHRVMKRHGIGPEEVATIIVKMIAPTLPKWVQTALIGDWKDERRKIKLLAERVRASAREREEIARPRSSPP
jgi:hypothetical protein